MHIFVHTTEKWLVLPYLEKAFNVKTHTVMSVCMCLYGSYVDIVRYQLTPDEGGAPAVLFV